MLSTSGGENKVPKKVVVPFDVDHMIFCISFCNDCFKLRYDSDISNWAVLDLMNSEISYMIRNI